MGESEERERCCLMKRSLAFLLLIGTSFAVDQPCVILKTHQYKFGENMARWTPHRPLEYVEGNYPDGFKWRWELGNTQVREIQQKGGKVVVVKPDYQLADLEDARKQCKGSAHENR
jgi:hypothetical protein